MGKFKTNTEGLIKYVCPTCGTPFEESEIIKNKVECTCDVCPEKTLTLDELITSDEDWSWCM